jgi:citrate lyase subunit beta / citryl-CoA lyase
MSVANKKNDMLLRSLLFVPGHVDRFFESALCSDADALVLDLEDSVPMDQKDFARECAGEKLGRIGGRYPAFARVNPAETGRLEGDTRAVVHEALTGIIFPKVRTAEDVREYGAFLSEVERSCGLPDGHCGIFPLIETCAAVLNVGEIVAASPRNMGLVFGHEDFLLDLQAVHAANESNLLVPRMRIAMAARSIGGHPIDTPYLQIKDVDGCRRRVDHSRELGFSGMLVLHPLQVAVANEGYAPSEEQVKEAKRILDQVNESMKAGRSIAFSDGRFTAPPIMKQAESVLALHRKVIAKGETGK